jgi:hypothetical protein
MQRSEMRRVQRSRCIIKSKAEERRWVKVGGISKARLKPLKRRSGKLGFNSQVTAPSRHNMYVFKKLLKRFSKRNNKSFLFLFE